VHGTYTIIMKTEVAGALL